MLDFSFDRWLISGLCSLFRTNTGRLVRFFCRLLRFFSFHFCGRKLTRARSLWCRLFGISSGLNEFLIVVCHDCVVHDLCMKLLIVKNGRLSEVLCRSFISQEGVLRAPSEDGSSGPLLLVPAHIEALILFLRFSFSRGLYLVEVVIGLIHSRVSATSESCELSVLFGWGSLRHLAL